MASRIPDLAELRDLTTDHPVASLQQILSYASLRLGKFRARRDNLFHMAFVVPNDILSGSCSFLGGPGIGCAATGPSTDLTTGSSLSLRSVVPGCCADRCWTANADTVAGCPAEEALKKRLVD